MKYDEVVAKLLELENKLNEIQASIGKTSSEIAASTGTANMALAIASVNEYIHVLTAATRLAKKCGLPEILTDVIGEIQKIIRWINSLKVAYAAMAAAQAASGDPMAVIRLGIAVGSSTIQSMELSKR